MKSLCCCRRDRRRTTNESMTSKANNRRPDGSAVMMDPAPSKSSSSSSSSSCFSWVRVWRFWRNICCLYGFYPTLVAPIITAGFLLSLYSTTGCNYVDVDIGFTPSNAAYNQSQANLGFFYYNSHNAVTTEQQQDSNNNVFLETFHGGCYLYTQSFQDEFMNQDRTWKVAQIMAIIAVCAGFVSTIMVWLMVVTPLSVSMFWPTILLPLVMLSFIAEGSKFLIFDIALCNNSVWLPSGVDSTPQTAESCTIGLSAIYGIVSGSLFLVALLMVCLYTPDRRILDPNYGRMTPSTAVANDTEIEHLKDTNDDTEVPPHDDSNTSHDDEGLGAMSGGPDNDLEATYNNPTRTIRDIESSDFGEEDIYTTVGTTFSVRTQNSEQQLSMQGSLPQSEGSYDNPSATHMSEHTGSPTTNDASTSSPRSESQPDLGESPPERISESRLSQMEKLELSGHHQYASLTSSDILQELVSELNDSLSGGTNSATSSMNTTNLPLRSSLIALPPQSEDPSGTVQRFL